MDLMKRLVTTSGVLCVLLCVWFCCPDQERDGSYVLRRRLVLLNVAAYHHRDLQSSNSTSELYRVTLVLALSYLNDSVALNLESMDSSNELVSHFCMAVNTQAGGRQVQDAADEIGVVVETFVKNDISDGLPDYQCNIPDTNRAYDNLSNEIFGEGYFTLELKVKQAVYVTAPPGRILSDNDIYNLVLNGFNRDDGGRLTFRSLLRQNANFATVLGVSILDDLSSPPSVPTSSPVDTPEPTPEPTKKPTSASPTPAPTQTETDSPSPAPTVDKTTEPTVTPTLTPSSESPTASPTVAPTPAATSLRPSDYPSNAPSPSPSEWPSAAPPSAQPSSGSTKEPELVEANEEDNRLPLIFGAIAGGAAALLSSCFFIFCVWFPICRPKPRNDSDDENGDGARREDGVSSRRLCQTGLLTSARRQQPEPPIVPDEVQLDADCESLADTTLGDLTAGGEILKIQQQQQQQQQQQPKTTKIESTVVAGSFDDNSIYTNGVEANAIETSIAPSTQSKVFNKVTSTTTLTSPSLSRTVESPASNASAEANRESSKKSGILFRGTENKKIGSLSSASTSPSFAGTGTAKSDKKKKGTSSSFSSPASFVASTGAVKSDKKKSSASSSSSFAGTRTVKSDKKNGSRSVTSIPPSSVGTNPVMSGEDRAMNVARSMDAGTKGFDPFNDDSSGSSSFGFGENPEQNYLKLLEEKPSPARSSPSLSASQMTKKMGNHVLGSPPGGRRRLLEPTDDEEKLEVDDEIFDDPSSLNVFPGDGLPPSSRKTGTISVKQPENNTLLRTVLEDARRMSHSRGSFSRRSAPSRLAEEQDESRKLADNPDLEGFISVSGRNSRPRTSAKTVGASVYSSSRSSMRNADVKAKDNRGGNPPIRTRYLDRGAVVSPPDMSLPQHPTQVANEPKAGPSSKSKLAVTPDSSVKKRQPSTPMSSPAMEDGMGTLGAERRDSRFDRLISGGNPPDTPASSPGVLGIAVKQKGKKSVQDDGSSGSEGLSNPWLFDTIEQTLGPRSPAADMESISGRSSRSGRSFKSGRSGKSGKSGNSSKSRRSHDTSRSRSSKKAASHSEVTPDRNKPSMNTSRSYSSRASASKETISGTLGEYKDAAAEDPLTPRTLEYDLQRLEVHVADVNHQDHDQMTTSTITASTAGASRSTLSSMRLPPRRSKKKRVVVVVPPGKLGVVLADRHDGKGTVVSEVRSTSAMAGMLSPGDKLVAIDGEDVRDMFVSQVTKIMASKIYQERRLTILTYTEFDDLPETKDEDFDE